MNEKQKYFKERTDRHRALVKKYGCKIYLFDPGVYDPLLAQLLKHDQSKYEFEESGPYIEITWMYKQRREGVKPALPDGLRAAMHEATVHHITTNDHHPEFWAPQHQHLFLHNEDIAPGGVTVDATEMPSLCIAEMVADWCAVSEEKDACPFEWARNNIGYRWNFSPDQVSLIYKLIDAAWEEKR